MCRAIGKINVQSGNKVQLINLAQSLQIVCGMLEEAGEMESLVIVMQDVTILALQYDQLNFYQSME